MSGAGLPPGVLLAFYGDDFTGSSAVMEVTTFAGLRAVMFVEPPTQEQLEQFRDYRAIGVASVARAQSPGWMDRHLPGAFRALAALRAPITHYKVCSTLDSSPTIGSIGRAIDIGVPIFCGEESAAPWQPLVVAAPAIGRYQAFGNLFAAHAGAVHRLDRHPVMQLHPVTPMQEADVARHVQRQTRRAIGLIDLAAMKGGSGQKRFECELREGRSILSLDVVDEETLRWVGGLIWNNRHGGLFAIGSQGVEYALVAYWRATGLLPHSAPAEDAQRRSQIAAVSGSVSAVTAAQIAWAVAHGFELIQLDPAFSLDERRWAAAVEEALKHAHVSLSRGRSPLIATAQGPDDTAVAGFREALASSKLDAAAVNERIGAGLGEILRRLVCEAGLKRAAVSGGDTSGFAMRTLGAYALEAIAPIAPGAPLCRVFSTHPTIDGLEISLKGGQMGETNFFGSVRTGYGPANGGTT
jgi:3-oxoisoapionate kinase